MRSGLAGWWASPEWHAYEAAYGDAPGTRTRLLASAEWSTRILDLTLDEATLWRGVRKGHRADIRKASREYVFDAGTNPALVLCYAGVHQRAHPGARAAETYRHQGHWADVGHGLVVVAAREWPLSNVAKTATAVAAAYFLIHDHAAYYASSAALVPDVMAAVVWHGILALKARGVRILELGWQGHAMDAKGKNVEFFRRGFGGVDVPARAGEGRLT